MRGLTLLSLLACMSAAAAAQHQIAHLTASDGQQDGFGGGVAVRGDVAFIAASGDDDRVFNAGAVYVFERSGGRWSEAAKLTSPDAGYEEYFGLSLSFDGERAIVGEPYDQRSGEYDGAAFIIERVGGAWAVAGRLSASDPAADDWFGMSVAIGGDIALVGSPNDDDQHKSSGSAYVFERVGGAWTQTAKLVAADAAEDDHLGGSVCIAGSTAFVAARYDDDLGAQFGSVYVFERDAGLWGQTAKLTASDGKPNGYFGRSISVSAYTLVVGAWDGLEQRGAAYLFERDGATWAETRKLTASDGEDDDHFGWSVAIDGDTILVGAFGDDDHGSSSGSAYVFKRREGDWTEVAKLGAADGRGQDRFGDSVGLSGESALIGALYDDDLGRDAGSAYVFYVGDCAAEFNADGVLDTRDIIAFLNAWAAGDGAADFNGDGSVDAADVQGFLGAWSAGC